MVKRAVERLLADDEWARWSNREIAKRCAVDDKFVGNVRRELSADDPQIGDPPARKATRKGTTYTQRQRKPGIPRDLLILPLAAHKPA